MHTAGEVSVELPLHSDPLITRAFGILKDRVQQRCSAPVVEDGAGAQIILAVDGGLPPEAFHIDGAGAAGAYFGRFTARFALRCREVPPDQPV